MEATRINQSPYGRPMEREASGHAGGGDLFIVRREAHFSRGLMSERGYNDNYLTFRPAPVFERDLGECALHFNDALLEFRGRVGEHLAVFDQEGLKTHYAELNRRVEVVRDRLVGLIACCHKGFDGQFKDVLEAGPEETAGDEEETTASGNGARMGFDAVRQRNVEEGILTELGRERGYVAFRPCPFYGRVVGEIVYTFNDALLRMEGRLPYYIMGGEEELVLKYYGRLRKDASVLRGDLQEVVEYCRAGNEPV